MITKAIIQSIDYNKNICRVRIPLFEQASRNVNTVEADAQFSVVPGIYNSYKTGDIVFIGFEEDKLELPVILGKLFVSTSAETSAYRGNVSGNSITITDTAQLPHSTVFNYDKISQNKALYNDLNTPKKLADSIMTLQRQPTQRYQTVIKISVGDEEPVEYDLYLKTSNDFTYSTDKAEEPLHRLFAALKDSQADSILVPLDVAINKSGTVFQAFLLVSKATSTEIEFNISIAENTYTLDKSNILAVYSTAIQY